MIIGGVLMKLSSLRGGKTPEQDIMRGWKVVNEAELIKACRDPQTGLNKVLEGR